MVQLHEMLRLSSVAYTRRERSGAWSRVAEYGDSGFRAGLWIHASTNDAVLSIRGTAGPGDALQDARLLFGREPRAWRHGRTALDQARREMPARGRLALTGHSIGGAFASALGAEQQVPTVTFNAPGMLEALRRSHADAPCPAWVRPGHRQLIDISIRADWIRLLSGPPLGARCLIGPGRSTSLRGAGPRALAETLRHGVRREGLSFVTDSIRNHAVTAFRPFAEAGRGLAWDMNIHRLLPSDASTSLTASPDDS
ncbi:MAG: hypothetical protein GY711_34735 [bacterium]|nr:hypothetical protein [bacterium]